MTKWLAREFLDDEWRPVQYQFEDLWRSLQYPKSMLLGLQYEPDTRTTKLVMRVPDPLASQFLGFEEIKRSQLPKRATCLDDRDGEFWKFFERHGD